MRGTLRASFVGRTAELTEVCELLEQRPLVSVVGEGGVGKTRLATEIAAVRRERDLPVAWAELATARTPAGVRDAVVDALPPGSDASSLDDLLAARLRGGLLVLDNCEHVLDPVLEVVEAVDRACPDVRVLTTTRERLGLPGEATYRLGPLPVPPPGVPLDEAAGSPAVQLLADRVRDVLGEIPDSEATLNCLLTLARVVEGSPLGLELAAARAASIPLDDLARLLPDPLRHAAGPQRGRPARHRSLDANVRWSIDLLSPEGSRLLQLLSVFADSFTLATARAVTDGVAGLPPHSLELVLGELVEASVVRLGADGRYRLPAAVRFLARDLLAEAGLADEARDRHAKALHALVAVDARSLVREDHVAWMAMLDAELAEVRAALDWCLRRDRPDEAADMLLVVWGHWSLRGRYGEFTRRSEELIAHPKASEAQRGSVAAIASRVALMAGRLQHSYHLGTLAVQARGLDDPCRARALVNRAWAGFLSGLGSDDQIWADAAEGRRIAQQFGDEDLIRELDRSWAGLTTMTRSIPDGTELGADVAARCARLTGQMTDNLLSQCTGTALLDLRLEHRAAICREALVQTRAMGNPSGQSAALTALGTIAALRGDEDTTDLHLEEAVAVAAQHDLTTFVAINQRWRAFAHYRFDRDDTAAQAERAVALAQTVGSRWDEAAGLWLLGLARLRAGDTEEASRVLSQAAEASVDPSYPFSRLRSELGLAIIDLQHDRHHDALNRVHEAITTASGLGDVLGLAASLDHLALLESHREAHDRAAHLLGAVDALHEATSVTRLPFEAQLRQQTGDRLAAAIGDRAAAEAIESGRSLSPDQAVRLARRSRGARKRPSRGWDSLTPAERDVADLAVEGLANAQIAERLFISTNTVKTHLRQVYAKLDITSRAQLATIHAEQAASA